MRFLNSLAWDVLACVALVFVRFVLFLSLLLMFFPYFLDPFFF